MAITDQLAGSRRVSNKQLRLWAAATGTPAYINTITAAISADTEDAESVFYYGGDMIEGDALADAIQTALGLSDGAWSSAISTMLGYQR